MYSLAIIPLRAGSKGILHKNRTKILGRPLFAWVLTEAVFSNLDKVVVFTDDDVITDFIKKEYTWTDKIEVIQRSDESASDTASTEMAMEELLTKINFDFDVYCLLQATSVLTTRNDINKALNSIKNNGTDSVLSVVETKRFVWSKQGESINYDYLNRPRRQDFDGLLIENGAVYMTKKECFSKTKNRISGKIDLLKMPEDTLVEIDEPSDLIMAEQLLLQRIKNKNPLGEIKLLCLDVDGVFTDSTVQVSHNGEFSKSFSLRDGMGIELLRNSGVEVCVITSEDSEIVRQRMNKLKLGKVFLGVKDKYSFLQKLCIEENIDKQNIAYLGDDVNDMANILACNLGFCPNDAELEIKQVSDIILNNKGGEKAIREACNFIIKHNKRFK